jgi:hypothetical protein
MQTETVVALESEPLQLRSETRQPEKDKSSRGTSPEYADGKLKEQVVTFATFFTVNELATLAKVKRQTILNAARNKRIVTQDIIEVSGHNKGRKKHLIPAASAFKSYPQAKVAWEAQNQLAIHAKAEAERLKAEERQAQEAQEIAARAWSGIKPVAANKEQKAFESWIKKFIPKADEDDLQHETRVSKASGYLNARVVGFLGEVTLTKIKERGLIPASAAIEIRGREAAHMLRPSKQKRGAGVLATDALNMVSLLKKPDAVLYDIKNPALLYVFKPEQGGKHGKFVIGVGIETQVTVKGKLVVRKMNSVRTAGLVEKHNLTDANMYEVLEGSL